VVGSRLARKKAKLVGEGYTQDFDIAPDGRFRFKAVLRSGLNRLKIVVGHRSADQHVTLDRAPVSLRATLTWNHGNSDVDLHLIDPAGQRCSYQAKTVGTMQLDVDNTSGYGPENIYVARATRGTYSVEVQNYARA